MTFKKGDKVYNKTLNREGIVNVSGRAWVEVEYDGHPYYWNVNQIEKVTDTGRKWASDPLGWYDDWDREYNSVPDKINKCVCSSRDLFHYGCRCGFFKQEKEKNEVQG
jgi:hypothetical protein